MALQIAAAILNTVLPYWMLLVPLAISAPILIPLYCRFLEARATRLRYVVVPNFIFDFILQTLYSYTVLKPLNKILPEPSVTSPRLLGTATWPLKVYHETFKALGTDNCLTVSPGGNIFNTADANVISQILAQGAGFPKAIEVYKSIAIYGQNGTYHTLKPHPLSEIVPL